MTDLRSHPDITPGSAPTSIPARALYVGERIDTRGLEPAESPRLSPVVLPLGNHGLAVIFRYGVVVLFNVDSEGERRLLDRLAPHLVGAAQTVEIERAHVEVIPAKDGEIDANGTIFVRMATVECFQAIADALAKSLLLAHYETRIAAIFDRLEPLANNLREKGRIGAYGATLMRQIGDVLHMQHRMVGRVETGETPELLWDHPELERLYLRLSEEYELRERSRALDRKLDVISRTAETLLGLIQNRTTLRVEWYILALILAELALSIYPLILRWFGF